MHFIVNQIIPSLLLSNDHKREILEIKLKARYSFNKGKFKIQTGINFVTDRVKDNSVLWYDPAQAEFNFDFNGDQKSDDEIPGDE